MHGMRGHSQRRSFAICAALLWLLGVEVLPNLHLAFHEGDHTHAVDGSIVATRDAELERLYLRAHAERGTQPRQLFVRHDHGKPKRRDHGGRTIDEAPHGHAAAGIAHHATALHQPPPPRLAPVTAPIASHVRSFAREARASIVSIARPVARGPPVA